MAANLIESYPTKLAPNAALGWQAGSRGRRSMELVETCPLEGFVRSVSSLQTTFVILRDNSRIQLILGDG